MVASETPNPNARKFTASVPVVALGAVSVHTAADAARHPISAALFAIEGVTGVFAVKDFVTVTATPGADWDALGAQVARTIADVLESAR